MYLGRFWSNAVDRLTYPRMNGHTSDRALRIFGHMGGGLSRINGHTIRPQSLCWCGFPTSSGSSFLYLMPVVVGGARWTTRYAIAFATTEEGRARTSDQGCGAQELDAVTNLFMLDVSGSAPFSSVVALGRRLGGGGVFGGWPDSTFGSKGVFFARLVARNSSCSAARTLRF
jgi:hypothetical protein